MIFASRLAVTSLAFALSLGFAGACYDLTPVPPSGTGGGAPCSPDPSIPDACAPETPDAGDVDGDVDAGTNSDSDTDTDGEPGNDADTDGGPSAEEPNP